MKYTHIMRMDGWQSVVECEEAGGEEGWGFLWSVWCSWRGKIGDDCGCQRMAKVRVWGLKGLSLGGLAFTVWCVSFGVPWEVSSACEKVEFR